MVLQCPSSLLKFTACSRWQHHFVHTVILHKVYLTTKAVVVIEYSSSQLAYSAWSWFKSVPQDLLYIYIRLDQRKIIVQNWQFHNLVDSVTILDSQCTISLQSKKLISLVLTSDLYFWHIIYHIFFMSWNIFKTEIIRPILLKPSLLSTALGWRTTYIKDGHYDSQSL
jgi:hypothetical protein